VLVGIKFEEKKLLIEFGNSYKNYSTKVPMLIPNFKSDRK
jgi:protein-S-isoprenylcysteine O-methyltransferase Ste14